MSPFKLEINKILKRRFALILLVVTLILFPLGLKVMTHLHSLDKNTVEDLFPDQVAYAAIAMTQLFLFLPTWIIIFTGQELSNGHVNRVSFISSRAFYFKSKMIYCLIVTIVFSAISLIGVIVSIKTSAFTNLNVGVYYFITFLTQVFTATLFFCFLLLCLVFLFRSPIVSFAVYFIWQFVEGLVVLFGTKQFNTDLSWLPLHLVKKIYSLTGNDKMEDYYNPLTDNPQALILPIAFIILLLTITYWKFLKSDLKTLSD